MDQPPESDPLDQILHFLRSAVHDLRAAQRRTGVSAELLLTSSGDQERADLIAQMLLGLAKTEELLSAITNYANVLTPHSYSFNPFPVAVAVRFAVATLDREIRDTGTSITFGDLPTVRGDRDKLAELFAALIGNSIKFRGVEPPAVHIGATRVPEGWRFSVADNGVGIPPKYHKRLFIPFSRLHSADFPGAGLGLAISKKIVEAHGGRIWIDDSTQPGVSIFFVLTANDGD